MKRHRYRTNDVLAILEADEDMSHRSIRTDVYISPPTDPACSDEDSGDEDTGGDYNNLSSKQLESEAVATVRTLNGDVRIGEELKMTALKQKKTTAQHQKQKHHLQPREIIFPQASQNQ